MLAISSRYRYAFILCRKRVKSQSWISVTQFEQQSQIPLCQIRPTKLEISLNEFSSKSYIYYQQFFRPTENVMSICYFLLERTGHENSYIKISKWGILTFHGGNLRFHSAALMSKKIITEFKFVSTLYCCLFLWRITLAQFCAIFGILHLAYIVTVCPNEFKKSQASSMLCTLISIFIWMFSVNVCQNFMSVSRTFYLNK